MDGIFGITGQAASVRLTSQLEDNWCALTGFAHRFDSERFHLFITGNSLCLEQFNAASFFGLLEKDVTRALNSLEGLFCGAIWDNASRELQVFTDPFSAFPIFYTHNEYKAVFSDSVKDLVNSGEVEIQLDATAVMDYFRFNRLLPSKTLFTGVSQLEPGQYLCIHEDYLRVGNYWDWSNRRYTEFHSLEQIFAKLDQFQFNTTNENKFPDNLNFSSLTDWVKRLDQPVDGPWTDPGQGAVAEIVGANEVFPSLLSLMKKKWPMSFPVFLRSYLAQTGFWKWPGLTGRWRKERMVQEYWDIEFLYQFEGLNWSDERIKTFFKWSNYPKNGLFVFLNERIGYGKPGFMLPPAGRVSFAELHHKTLAQYLPIWRAVHENATLDFISPYFNKKWMSYVMSIPDGLKDSNLEDSIAKHYHISPTREEFLNLPLPTEKEWILIEQGLAQLPLVKLDVLMEAARKQPECFRGITILGLWLATQIQYETR
jgi:hypothetical protein